LEQESAMVDETKQAYLKRRRHEIGQRIREIRRRNNMSQEEVADYLGCSRIKVNRVENGLTDFSVVELELLAQRLDVTILHFLGIELTVSVPGSERQFSVPV